MSASITDKITDVRNTARPNAATVATPRTAGGNTLACNNLTGWPTASKVHFVTYKVDSSSALIPGSQLDCSAIVSGNSLTSFTVIDGTDTGHAVQDKVVMLPTAAYGQDLADAFTAQHSRTGAHKSITTDTLVVSSGTTLPPGDIVTADLADGAVTSAKVATGAVVQVVSTGFGALATGTTQIPLDDTIPQSNEGDQYMTQAITPKSATNNLIITVVFYGSFAVTANDLIVALFQDSATDALTATSTTPAGTNYRTPMTLSYPMTAGTTSATTFKVRAGAAGVGTTTFNGAASARFFGAITKSSITIMEYKA